MYISIALKYFETRSALVIKRNKRIKFRQKISHGLLYFNVSYLSIENRNNLYVFGNHGSVSIRK